MTATTKLAENVAANKSRMVRVHDLLEQCKGEIARAAPRHLSPDRILRIAMTTIRQVPKLADCSPESLLGSLMTCTQLGLEPDGASGRAYLIPYGRTCTLIIGYKGLMELARRSGKISHLEARVVYSGDKFEVNYGSKPNITHKPNLSDERGTPIASYAVATFNDGSEPQVEVMTVGEINNIRDRSKAAGGGPWKTDWSEMARKTVMRRLCKYLPSSSELQQAVTIDEQAELGIPQTFSPVVDVEFGDNHTKTGPPKSARTKKLVKDLKGKEPDNEGDVRLRRASIKAQFKTLDGDRQESFLNNVGLEGIEGIEEIASVEHLDSIREAIIGA